MLVGVRQGYWKYEIDQYCKKRYNSNYKGIFMGLMKYYRKNRETALAVIGFTVILVFFVYRDVIRIRWIKANGEFKILEGVVTEYYNKASRSHGVMVYYYFLDRNYKTPCTTKLCQNLIVGDSVTLKVYLKNPEIIDVIKKK